MVRLHIIFLVTVVACALSEWQTSEDGECDSASLMQASSLMQRTSVTLHDEQLPSAMDGLWTSSDMPTVCPTSNPYCLLRIDGNDCTLVDQYGGKAGEVWCINQRASQSVVHIAGPDKMSKHVVWRTTMCTQKPIDAVCPNREFALTKRDDNMEFEVSEKQSDENFETVATLVAATSIPSNLQGTWDVGTDIPSCSTADGCVLIITASTCQLTGTLDVAVQCRLAGTVWVLAAKPSSSTATETVYYLSSYADGELTVAYEDDGPVVVFYPTQ